VARRRAAARRDARRDPRREPGGLFTTDDWALPWHVPSGDKVPAPAARGISLLADSAGYSGTLFASAGGLDAREAAAVSVSASSPSTAGTWKRGGLGECHGPLSPADMDCLGAGWNRFRADVNAMVKPAARERLQRVVGHH
jgi:hypothetical protein